MLPGAPRRRDDFFHAHRLHALSENFPVDSVTIPQQIPRLGLVRKRLDDLLRRPWRRGMFGHIEMQHASTMVSQDHLHKQDSKRCRGHNEKIDRDKVLKMIVQERTPRL